MTSKAKNFKLDVAALVKPMMEVHDSGINQTYQWRMEQLKRMKRLLTENREEICQALFEDLRRCPEEADLSEARLLEHQVDVSISQLRRWMEPQKVPSPMLLFPTFSQIEHKPLRGPAVCIIGAFNFPIFLCIQPAIGALAAGNPVVMKPSELCPAMASLLATLVAKYFSPDAVRVVTGGVSETKALLEQSWGKLVFTGSERVGRIVAQAAATTLTPAILELGGKCPAYVDETVPIRHLQNVADRIIFTKCLNSGQVCVAPDTLIVHEKHAKQLCRALVTALETQFGKDPSKSRMTRMVAEAHAERLVECLKEIERLQLQDPKIETLFGGSAKCNSKMRYVCPTLILNPPSDCRLMKEEIFGPILPIVVVPSRDAAVNFIRQKMYGTPLALYIYTNEDRVFQEMTRRCPSSSAFRNDALVHLSNPNTPIGGLDTSGYGCYQGKFSFESFSHVYPTFYRPFGSFLADVGGVRCHPYTDWKRFLLKVIVHVPEIPVVPWNLLAAVAAAGFVLLSRTAVAGDIRNLLADGLNHLEAYLRR